MFGGIENVPFSFPVHWRSDYTQSLLLGEQLALSILNDQLDTYSEKDKILKTGWNFQGFEGKPIAITGCK